MVVLIAKMGALIVLRFILFTTVFLPFLVLAKPNTELKVLKLATTEWCPYICQNSKLGKGLVYDYLTMILEPRGIQIDVTFLPWADAITSANTGKHDGLIAAIRSEAPELIFTKVPTMHYKMCFFNGKGDKWEYKGKASLSDKVFGTIEGYGYGEPVDTFIRAPENAHMVKVFSGDNSLQRLNRLLSNKDIDVFIEDGYVVKWQNRDLSQANFKQAGCMRPVPFYMAFNQAFAEQSQIVETINDALSDPKFRNYLNQYMLPYYLSSKASKSEK